MSGRGNQAGQIAAISSIVEAAPHGVVKSHLRAIIESPAFKGSRRSQEFLRFVVEHALEGRFDDLKERVLGVELFGRAPSYDTGDDAIVRVTACDVRKRIHHFYAELGQTPQLRIELPPGSYIPEIQLIAQPDRPTKPSDTVEIQKLPAPAAPDAEVPSSGVSKARWNGRHMRRGLQTGLACSILLVLAATFWFWRIRPALGAAPPVRVLPWSAMIQANRPIHLIFCDPEIVNVQRLLNYSVTLSDYANQRYWPSEMAPEARRVFQSISFRGASVAAVDTSIAFRIDGLLHPATKQAIQMQMHTARSVRLSDFKTEDSFVLFGSPRSNPWVHLFEDQLDFTFEFDPVRKAEYVRNRHPQKGESEAYIPTAEGWETGHAFAIVALVANPEQGGKVLLLAGSNAEATEAAGKLATDGDAISRILGGAGIDSRGAMRRFEILLRVSTMAGSPNTYELVACHALSGR